MKFSYKPLFIAMLCGVLGLASAAASPQYLMKFRAAGVRAAGAPAPGTGTNPADPASSGLVLSASSLTFSETWVSLLSGEQVVQVSNPTSTPLAVLGAALTSGAEDFRMTNECGTVAPGGTCRVLVLYAPNAAGPDTGTLAITTAAGTTNVALSGSAKAPSVTLSTPVFADAYYPVRSTGVARLTNDSFEAITLTTPTQMSFSMPRQVFRMDSTTCGTSLAPGASCDTAFSTNFTIPGQRTSVFTIKTSAGDRPITVTAMVWAGQAVLAPDASITFEDTTVTATSVIKSVTLSNTGNAPLTFTGISLEKKQAFEQSNNCGAPLSPGQSCIVNLVFAPSIAGRFADSLVVGHDGLGTPAMSMLGDARPVAAVFTVLPKAGPNGGNMEVTWSVTGMPEPNTVRLSCLSATLWDGAWGGGTVYGNNRSVEMQSAPGTFDCRIFVTYPSGSGYDTSFEFRHTYTVP